MFATSPARVRRNKLSDFVNVNRDGKIAMKLDEGDRIVDVQICTEDDDVLLTTARGQCIRFCVDDVRVFKGRNSTGVRGIALAKDDDGHRHGDPAPCRGDAPRSAPPISRCAAPWPARAQRRARLRPRRRGGGEEADAVGLCRRSAMSRLCAREQVILTLSQNGYGKRTSAYEFRVTGRGGKGIVAMAVNEPQRPAGGVLPGRELATRSCW